MPRLIRIRQLRDMLDHSNATIYRLIKNAGLPPPLKLTSRTSAWDEDSVFRWLSARTTVQDLQSTSTGATSPNASSSETDSEIENQLRGAK
jgi:predicted DNA-binding transcriptional regulator AlpA